MLPRHPSRTAPVNRPNLSYGPPRRGMRSHSLARGRIRSRRMRSRNLARGSIRSCDMRSRSLARGRIRRRGMRSRSLARGRFRSRDMRCHSLARGRFRSRGMRSRSLARGRLRSHKCEVHRPAEIFAATARAVESAGGSAKHAADQSARYAQEARFVIGAVVVAVFVIAGPLDFIRGGDQLGLAGKPKRGVAPKRGPHGAIAGVAGCGWHSRSRNNSSSP